jgi:hypothetical protein
LQIQRAETGYYFTCRLLKENSYHS